MDEVVSVQGLRKHFWVKDKPAGLLGSLRALARPRSRLVAAVDGVDFAVAAGDVVAVLGPNGAGKSTTLKMLTGILHPTAGQATVLGLVPWRQRQRLAYQIAAVFGQRSQLWYHLPPIDSFALLAQIYDVPARDYRTRLTRLVERFDLAPFLQTPVRKLSLGERMRCEIAGALLHRPRVLFLDEPTIGLDVVAKQRLRLHLRALQAEEGLTILLTSHDTGDVEHLCRRVLIINHGRVIFDDAVAALRRRVSHAKRVSLQIVGDEPFAAPAGSQVIERTDYHLTLAVDTDRYPIETVVGPLVASGRVADLTIFDPPLEEIIATLYGAAS